MSTGAIPPSYPMLSLSPPPLNLSQHWGFSSKLILHIRWTYWSFSFSISPSNEYSGLISFSCLVGSPCSPRDSQEYSPAQQFESINSSAFTFIYSPTLNIHTWLLEKPQLWLYGPLLAKWCLFFFIHCRFVIGFFPRSKCFFFFKQVSFNFMAAVSICSDLGAQENKICFHFSPIYLLWSDGTRCHDLIFF